MADPHGAIDRNTVPLRVMQDAMTPVTVNVAMVSSDTEYSYELPQGTKKFSIKLRSQTVDMKLNIGKISGQSDINYINMVFNTMYWEEGLNTDKGTKLFFQSPSRLHS